MIDPVFALIFAYSGALLFATSALHKLRDFQRFRAILQAYGVPPIALSPMGWLIPAVELSTGVLLSIASSRSAAATMGAALLLVYAVVMQINLRHGRHDLDCGCGDLSQQRRIEPWMVRRNVCLSALLILAALPTTGRNFSATDALTVAAACVALALIYVALDRLFGELQPRAQKLRRSP